MAVEAKQSYQEQALLMVKEQIQVRGVKDHRVLKAMGEVQRHLFVPQEFSCIAYEDHPLNIGYYQTISQPFMVALMTEALEVEDHHTVLEIGTGSAYQTAVLSKLVYHVYSIERISELHEKAIRILAELNYDNVSLEIKDGTSGWRDKAPFDRIIVTAGAKKIPKLLIEQLAINGIMIIPVGKGRVQNLIKIKKKNLPEEPDNFFLDIKSLEHCTFVPLIGEYA